MSTSTTNQPYLISSDFSLPTNDHNDSLLAPLITARLSEDGGSILVRIVVFIPGVSGDSTQPKLTFLGVTGCQLTCTVDFTESNEPVSPCEVYYLEAEYAENVPAIEEVCVFLNNKDPRTSRGTVTTVQTS